MQSEKKGEHVCAKNYYVKQVYVCMVNVKDAHAVEGEVEKVNEELYHEQNFKKNEVLEQ